MTILDVGSWYQLHKSRIHKELAEFLSFPSISASPEFAEGCIKCASWLLQHLKQIGCSEVRQVQIPGGHPIIRASFFKDKTAPTVLYYGHYDVFSVSDLADWNSEPFKPEIRGERIYARGAQDNKGQTFYFIKALEYLIATQSLAVNLEIIIEGEEETTTSPSLRAYLPQLKAELPKIDHLLVCDTDSLSESCGSIVLGLRGIINVTLEYASPKGDRHSEHGGTEPSSVAALVKSLSSLTSSNSRPLLQGYEVVQDLAVMTCSEVRSSAEKLHELNPEFSIEVYEKRIKARGFESTLEIGALVSGAIDGSVRTCIPARARVQITSRLVPGQKAEDCVQKIINHFEENCPQGLEFRVLSQGVGAEGIRFSSDKTGIKLAAEILHEIFGTSPFYDWEGSSIPFVSWIVPELVEDAVLVGFGIECQDRIHATNESFSLNQFSKGLFFCANFLQRLSK